MASQHNLPPGAASAPPANAPDNHYDLLVIGAGAAGFFAAINAARGRRLKVALIEGSPRVLTKVKISGGGRCNVTHACFEPRQLIKHYPRGHRELRGAFHRFGPQDTIAWFAKAGVPLKTESDGRMFPTSNSSATIIACLQEQAQQAGVRVITRCPVRQVEALPGGGFRLHTNQELVLSSRKLLLATGSSPQGHRLAASLGHSIVAPVPSLFTFMCQDPLWQGMAGQSFPAVALQLAAPKGSSSITHQAAGPLLVTHWGLSGPAVLRLSAFAARDLFNHDYRGRLWLNFCPGNNQETLYQAFAAAKASRPQARISSLKPEGFSKNFWEHFLATLGFNPQKNLQDSSNQMLRQLAGNLGRYEVAITGKGVFKEEFVTCGGVACREVDFRTMASQCNPDLYFAGEILDIDGITGGFNFQNAWTTAFIAATALGQNA